MTDREFRIVTAVGLLCGALWRLLLEPLRVWNERRGRRFDIGRGVRTDDSGPPGYPATCIVQGGVQPPALQGLRRNSFARRTSTRRAPRAQVPLARSRRARHGRGMRRPYDLSLERLT